ncbi:MAG: hypothetical protein HYT98_05280 [Candidatus Sungbacteria bacterium]|nr:hypothetical protein [Candidatus Sungbacteria bacterium]
MSKSEVELSGIAEDAAGFIAQKLAELNVNPYNDVMPCPVFEEVRLQTVLKLEKIIYDEITALNKHVLREKRRKLFERKEQVNHECDATLKELENLAKDLGIKLSGKDQVPAEKFTADGKACPGGGLE